MILDPIIPVECDECGEVIELYLTKIGKNWSDRDIKKRLEERGWIINMKDETFCCRGCQVIYEEE